MKWDTKNDNYLALKPIPSFERTACLMIQKELIKNFPQEPVNLSASYFKGNFSLDNINTDTLYVKGLDAAHECILSPFAISKLNSALQSK